MNQQCTGMLFFSMLLIITSNVHAELPAKAVKVIQGYKSEHPNLTLQDLSTVQAELSVATEYLPTKDKNAIESAANNLVAKAGLIGDRLFSQDKEEQIDITTWKKEITTTSPSLGALLEIALANEKKARQQALLKQPKDPQFANELNGVVTDMLQLPQGDKRAYQYRFLETWRDIIAGTQPVPTTPVKINNNVSGKVTVSVKRPHDVDAETKPAFRFSETFNLEVAPTDEATLQKFKAVNKFTNTIFVTSGDITKQFVALITNNQKPPEFTIKKNDDGTLSLVK